MMALMMVSIIYFLAVYAIFHHLGLMGVLEWLWQLGCSSTFWIIKMFEKEKTMTEKVKIQVEEMVDTTNEILKYYMELIILLGVAIVIVYLMSRIPYKRLFLRYVRGIKYVPEAMVSGSDFTLGKTPPYQIALEKITLFSTIHVGYGIRVSDSVMAVPAHVWEKFKGDEVVKMTGQKTTLMVPYKMGTMASMLNDLMFIRVSQKTFSELGVSLAKLSEKEFEKINVSITGKNKQLATSRGFLKPSKIMQFFYEYNGSTLPGYSGAAYCMGNVVYGIHVWADVERECNYGYTSKAIALELKYLVIEESLDDETTEQMGVAAKEVHTPKVEQKKKRDKSYEDLERHLKKDMNWADEVDEMIVEEESSLTQMQAQVLSTLTTMSPEDAALVMALFSGKVKITKQSGEDEQDEVDVPTYLEQQLEGILEQVAEIISTDKAELNLEISGLKGRISTLEIDLLTARQQIDETKADFEKQLKEKIEERREECIKQYTMYKSAANYAVKIGVEKQETLDKEPAPLRTIRLLKCPVEGCNRLFATEENAKAHVIDSPKHKGIVVQPESYVHKNVQATHIKVIGVSNGRPKLIEQESAISSDYNKHVKTEKKVNFLVRDASRRRNTPSLRSILNRLERNRGSSSE
nr:hypothetical protein 1 [Hypera postica associated sobemovirus 1]